MRSKFADLFLCLQDRMCFLVYKYTKKPLFTLVSVWQKKHSLNNFSIYCLTICYYSQSPFKIWISSWVSELKYNVCTDQQKTLTFFISLVKLSRKPFKLAKLSFSKSFFYFKNWLQIIFVYPPSDAGRWKTLGGNWWA